MASATAEATLHVLAAAPATVTATTTLHVLAPAAGSKPTATAQATLKVLAVAAPAALPEGLYHLRDGEAVPSHWERRINGVWRRL